MYKFLINKGQSVAFIAGAGISILFAILIFMGIKDRDIVQMSNEALIETDIFNFGIYAAIALIVIAAFLVFVVFGITGLFRDFASSKKVILGVAIIVILFIVFYATSQPETAGKLKAIADEFDISDKISRLISAGIKTTIALLGMSLVIWVLSELRNALK